MTEQELRDIFAYRLRKLAYARGFDNHKKLAEASGLTEATVSRYSNGKRTPNTNNLIRLAKTLDCTVDDLIMVEKHIY